MTMQSHQSLKKKKKRADINVQFQKSAYDSH